MSNKVNIRSINEKGSLSWTLSEESRDAISLSVSLIDSVCDVLRTVDVGELHEHTVCNLMHLQQEKLDEIRDLLRGEGKS